MSRSSQGSAVPQSTISQVVSGLRYALTGNSNGIWFAPMSPVPPAVKPEDAQAAGVAGRQLDYAAGYNANIKPRAYEAVSFETLRGLADSYDPLRIIIETRKDQACSLNWCIRFEDKDKDPDAACDKIRDFFRQPHPDYAWAEWLRMLLEDLYVLDAPSIYIHRTVGGDLYALEPIDGATIHRVIDPTGRTPLTGTAYQQILKGVPAVDYTRDELIYKPRNMRTNHVYGQSPVEQIINIVNIGLRRQMMTLHYFTEGTVPDALAGVSDQWTPQQISEFQQYWDMLLQDDMASRRKLKFVPGEIAKNFHEVKAPPLKDQFDEWVMRVVCYAFSIDATPFVAQVNRSVAETTREQSLSEGLASTKQWIKMLIDQIIRNQFGRNDIVFDWVPAEVIDPLVESQILTAYAGGKPIMTLDEARAKIGLEPLTPEQKEELNPTPPPTPYGPPDGSGEKPESKPEQTKTKSESGEGLAKAKKSIQPINRDRQAVKSAITDITTEIGTILDDSKAGIIKQIVNGVSVDDLDLSDLTQIADEVKDTLVMLAVDGGDQGLSQLGMLDDEIGRLTRAGATQMAEDRAAEMVGKKWVDGELVDNPNAEWRIDEGTRELLRSDVAQATEEGWSTDRLSDQLQENYAFSEERADMIARTEVAMADIKASEIAWQEAGIEEREWMASPDCCDECQAMDGKRAAIGETYEGGAEVPLHPNCRCDELPVVAEKSEADDNAV